MKLPISWATKTPIPSSELSTTGKGLHPGNGECFKGSLSRRHKRKLALRDTSQNRRARTSEAAQSKEKGQAQPESPSKTSGCPESGRWDHGGSQRQPTEP